jgi:hypothetical protein
MFAAMRCVALGSVVLLAASMRAQAAPQIWRLETKIDGDDNPLKVELDEHGALRVHGASGDATISIAATVSRANLHALRIAGVPTIVIEAATNAGDEGIVLERDTTSWKIVQRVALGAIGVDKEYGYELDVQPEGVYRYQTRPGYHRCDGKPAYLFAEGYTHDFGKFKRLSRIPTNVPDNAPVVGAVLDAASVTTPIVYRAGIASHQPGAHDAGELGIPSELDDGQTNTVWEEAFKASAGEGQFFTFEPRVAGAKASQLRIVPGNPAVSAHAVRRPRRLAVVWADGAVHVDLPDSNGAYVANLPAAIAGCVTVVLESTYGAMDAPTAIAELEVFADGERAGGGESLLAASVAAGVDMQSASQELARRGAAGVAALDTELGKSSDATARARLVRALFASHDPAAGPVLARAVEARHVRGTDLLDAITALGAFGQSTTLRGLAVDAKLDIPTRVAAVRALATKPDAALELAGSGPRQLRHAVIDVLIALDVDRLLDAARAQTSDSAAGDLYRAVTRRAHAQPTERARALSAMATALPAAHDYERRYRLIAALASLGDRAALDALPATLATTPGEQRAALAQVAAEAVAESPRADALPLALVLLRDRDPGVRLAALDAVAALAAAATFAGDDANRLDQTVDGTLASDTWPEVRRRAAQVLGDHCGRPAPAAALQAAVTRDPELDVRGDALAALVECRAASVATLLARTWTDGKAPLALRQRAVDLTVVLGDRALAAQLLTQFATWRGAALESPTALALAQNAANAIGRLAPPGAREALEAGLAEEAFPEIVAASAMGLGLLGPACPATTRAKLQRLARNEERQISVAAAHAAAVCGQPSSPPLVPGLPTSP